MSKLIAAADRIDMMEAACFTLETYLGAATFAAPRKLASIFKLLFSVEEMNAAIEILEQVGKVRRVRKYVVLDCRGN